MDYKTAKPDYVVSVLGTDYSVYMDVPNEEDETLRESCGYTDSTACRIVVCARPKQSDLSDWSVVRKSVLRHELIHAFLTESGIDGNTTWDIVGQDHPEQMVAWVANQFPKLVKAFRECDAL